MRTIHKIQNHFKINNLKTHLICKLCEASYNFDVQTTNLKNHYAKHHQKDYQLILATEEAKKKQVKNTNLKKKDISQFFVSLFENKEELEVVQTLIPLTKKRKTEETEEKTEKVNKKLKTIEVKNNIKETYSNQETKIEQEEYEKVEVDLNWVEEDSQEESSTIRPQADFENRSEEDSEEILVNETNEYYFKNGELLEDTINNLVEGKIKIKNFPYIEICLIKDIWYLSDNRRLYCFQQAIKKGLNIKKILVKV
ncbi:12560_t:CDS:2 [Racocetra persica]|uniref:12560_t:CDS:1 n=1 Tax=Racocetra persica TaxID=160502 RepID=A0ACA9L2K3_9GLOM|nr:12560_t:CDS:2 [Racocetra persica]